MPWYAIFETNSGRLVSIGERDESLTTDILSSSLIGGQPDLSTIMWDTTTRAFIARPPKVIIDRLDDFMSHPSYDDFRTLYNALSATNKARLRNIAIRLLGRNRYRSESQSVEIDE
jgi:hypothetical protein